MYNILYNAFYYLYYILLRDYITNTRAGALSSGGHERSYPRSEVGAVAEKSNPTSKEQLL